MIQLKKIRLINWYGFSKITVPVGAFTLIAGKNGNGKSVLLDAVKYALYGDTVFNKSTENKGSRTIPSYTRGLLDATAGSYMRPADKMPNVYTHIVLEMYEEDFERSFILGTVIETNSANGVVTQRYVMEDISLDEIEHTNKIDEFEYVYNASDLQKKYGLKMYSAIEGLSKFMQRTGLRLNEGQLSTFRRKLRSIMSYDPDAKIDQFIRESVLEEKKVDFSKLVETKNNIDNLTSTFEVIDNEIKELDGIITSFDELRKAENIIFEDDVKLVYRRFLKYKKQLEETSQKIDIAKRQIEEDEKKLEVIQEKDRKIRNDLNTARNNLDSMDCSKAIKEAEIALSEIDKKKKIINKQKQELLDFQTRVGELLAWLSDEKIEVESKQILSSLTLDSYDNAQKESTVKVFRKKLKSHRDEIMVEISNLRDAIKKNSDEQNKNQRIIDDCDAKKASFSEIPDYVSLKDEINNEFKKRGIESEARFACEYVLGLSDEAWRDVIEGYLGQRRYTILVEPEYYDIADDVLNSSKNKYAHLFNTKLLMKKDISPEEDSVINFIDIKNPVAQKYFEYQLGRFHAVTIDNVKNFENAMSVEGRISNAMDSYFIRFDRIRFYCLGQETIKLNRMKAVKRLGALKKEQEEYKEQLEIKKSKNSYLDTEIELFGDYNYDACLDYDNVILEYSKKEAELKSLQEAQKDNMEYMQLTKLVTDLEKERDLVEREMNAVRDDKAEKQTELRLNEKAHNEAEENMKTSDKQLKEYKFKNPLVYEDAVNDYDTYIAFGMTGRGGVLSDRAHAEKVLRDAGENLISRQSAYNAVRTEENRLPVTEDSQALYQSRKDKIWVDDRQEIQAELKNMTQRYEAVFKNEFVLTVLKSCETARSELKLINAELAHLNFKSTYEFDVKYVKDGSDYEKILEYAKFLKEREELGAPANQRTFDDVTGISDEKGEELDGEIKKIINRIVGSNDKEQIERFADYRNYMTYEILLTNDVLTRSKLSRQSGYNSGAEVQIPYMLILLSALLMIYNDKNNSTRLVFIDEPFAKMDPVNVKIMLGFMKDQKLQMIFCAPDKTELIGNECEVILPVLRTRPDLMEMGIVEMK